MRQKQQTLTIKRNIFLDFRVYRAFTLGCFAFLLAFLASAVLTPIPSSSAIDPAGSTIDVSNSINGYYLRFSASDTLPVSISATPASTLKAKTDTLNVVTNVNTGYKLSLSVQDMSGNASNNIYNTADVDKVSNHFSPVGSAYPDTTTLSANTWGFSLATGIGEVPAASTEWSAVPAEPVTIVSSNSPTPDAGDNIPITYGFSADTTLPAGSYQATILYTVYAENAEEFPYMQDFTLDQCNNMQTNEITTLTDNRDGKSYRVTKYADGNCWMSQNLALDPVDSNGNGITLTAKNTNISMLEIPSGSYTFPNDTVITSGTAASNEVPQAYTADQNKTTTSCNAETNPYCIVSEEKYGNYYNWLAATLGQGTTNISADGQIIYSSVCPRGWRLPDSGNNTSYGANAPDKSYSKLLYSDLGLNSVDADSVVGGAYIKDAQQAPFYFPLTGFYSDTMPINQGVSGLYWSRTIFSAPSNIVYSLNFSAKNGYISPQGNGNEKYGFPVRCVFEGAIEDNMKMQDVTIDMCNSLDESTTTADNRKTLIDIRDNKTYRVSKLADGNCWMVQNLALDGTDANGEVRELTPDDSDVTENCKLAANTTDNTTSSTEVKIYADKANDTTSSCDLATYPYCVESDEPYGNLYNWFAATATTGTSTMVNRDAPDSICPKNWKLPTSGNTTDTYGANAPDKSYGKLMYAVLGYNSAGGNGSGVYAQNAQKAPLYFPLAGVVYDSGRTLQGKNGYYWTRAAFTMGTNAHYFSVVANDENFNPQGGGSRIYGRSVRCVLVGS